MFEPLWSFTKSILFGAVHSVYFVIMRHRFAPVFLNFCKFKTKKEKSEKATRQSKQDLTAKTENPQENLGLKIRFTFGVEYGFL
jgi:hypothetical protein